MYEETRIDAMTDSFLNRVNYFSQTDYQIPIAW